MSDNYAILTTVYYQLKDGYKTVYEETSRSVESVSETHYENCVEAAPFFRRLGGSETLTREYTTKGYLVTRILSISPDGKTKVERLFDFDFDDRLLK